MGIFKLSDTSRKTTTAKPEATSDYVYPVHLLDNMTGATESNPVVLMRFNDVLDADKLHISLVKVLEKGDWRKAAGRFRRDPAGNLQLCAPARFTSERPAVRYSHTVFDIGIEEHPLARKLPRTTAQPSFQYSSDHVMPFCWEPGAPGTLTDYLQGDEPPIALRITSFLDATLVAISWSHVLADAVGFRHIVQAWCQVVAGREGDVAPVIGAREDAAVPIWETEMPKQERYIWESKMLMGLNFIWFLLRFAWQIISKRKVISRTIFLPASFIAKLRQEAENDLSKGSFISDGDILCAWLSRMIVSANSWTGPVALSNIVDIRSRILSVFKPNGVYIQNLFMPSMTLLPSRQILVKPLGIIASEVRRSLSLQTTDAQIRALYRHVIPHLKKKGFPPLFCDPDMLVVSISNWSKAKFVESVDFSPAVIRLGDQGVDRQNPPGSMVYQIAGQVKKSQMNRNSAIIIARDHSKNYWVNLYIAEALIGPIEEYVRNAGKESKEQ